MSGVTLGLFDDRMEAEAAITELSESGYNAQDISIIMRDAGEAQTMANDTGASVTQGAVSGATSGAMLGGLAGLLIGVGAIAIPGIGGLLIGGPIAAALGLSGAAATTVSGAVTGGVAGGLLGALMGLGVPESDAKVYEERIREGAILLAVPTRNEGDTEARGILETHGAEQTRFIATTDSWQRRSM
jgi:hypothetical protein